MNFYIFLFTMASASAFYTDMDESIDIDGMMEDPAKLKPYMDCYLDKGPCSDSATSFKKYFRDFLSNSCQDCDDKSKHIIEEFLLNVMVKYPEDMKALREKYDPTNTKFADLAYEVSKY